MIRSAFFSQYGNATFSHVEVEVDISSSGLFRSVSVIVSKSDSKVEEDPFV